MARPRHAIHGNLTENVLYLFHIFVLIPFSFFKATMNTARLQYIAKKKTAVKLTTYSKYVGKNT